MDGGGITSAKRRIMVIADPGRESAGALEWALYHAVLEHDEIILLHVEPPSSRRGALSSFLRRPSSVAPSIPARASAAGSAERGGDYEFLDAMRAACEAAQPKVKVQIERVEMDVKDKDKAAAILMQTKLLRIDLIVIGQRRTQSTFLGRKLGGRTGSTTNRGTDPAEFLIENSKCLCVGVQKKGQNAGYLLNTRTHKNFWLLA